jgi:hypothetical protein
MTDLKTMPAFTVYSPFAWAIAAGFKDVENRHDRFSQYRGFAAIHASMKGGRALREAAESVRRLVPEGATVPSDREFSEMCGSILGIAELGERLAPSSHPRSEWYHPGATAIQIDGAYRFETPVTGVKGNLGLWYLPDELFEKVMAAEVTFIIQRRR